MAEPFRGTIGRTYRESTPWWPDPRRTTADSPNVVLMMFDDLGFSHFGCYGSSIETPNIDQLAAGGLRYNNFHTTSLCSPTRACLMTGRNHHTVGMRSISAFDSGYPNCRGNITHHAATVAEMLREEGYATLCLGKWHLAQIQDCSAAGPFDQWPLGRGFDRFYGFLEGQTDQFYPELVCDNHRVDPPYGPDEGYHFTEDLIDKSMEFIRDLKSVRPDRPYFLYVPFGAMHQPHQAPREFIEKYRGRFDAGWDEDFSEYHNLAASEPEKLQEMIDLWWIEAGRHGVLPLDDRVGELFSISRFRHNMPNHRGRYVYYPPVTHIPAQVAPQLGFRNWYMTAEVELPEASDGGVILAMGTQTKGISWYIQDQHVVFDSNIATDHWVARSSETVPTGESTLGVSFAWEGNNGVLTLTIDRKKCGTAVLPSPMNIGSIGLRIGRDNMSPVSENYEPPFAFTGTIRRIEVRHPEYLTEADERAAARARFREEMAKQ